MNKAGQIFVMSGPSGTGKSTVAGRVRELLPELAYSVSVTTRQPRQGEINGVHYHFVTRQEFERMIAEGEMAEHAEIYGNYYGTSAEILRQSLEQGKDLLLEIDVDGAAQLRARFADGVFIFLLPPSMAELERRLRQRGAEDESVIAVRLERAAGEVAQAERYTHLVVNDSLDQAVDEVRAIIVAESLRTARRQWRIQDVLNS